MSTVDAHPKLSRRKSDRCRSAPRSGKPTDSGLPRPYYLGSRLVPLSRGLKLAIAELKTLETREKRNARICEIIDAVTGRIMRILAAQSDRNGLNAIYATVRLRELQTALWSAFHRDRLMAIEHAGDLFLRFIGRLCSSDPVCREAAARTVETLNQVLAVGSSAEIRAFLVQEGFVPLAASFPSAPDTKASAPHTE